MGILEFMGEHPILTVILGLIMIDLSANIMNGLTNIVRELRRPKNVATKDVGGYQPVKHEGEPKPPPKNPSAPTYPPGHPAHVPSIDQ